MIVTPPLSPLESWTTMGDYKRTFRFAASKIINIAIVTCEVVLGDMAWCLEYEGGQGGI